MQTSMDGVFQALASASRRKILDIVKNNPGCSVNAVCEHFDMSRIAVMKHLRVLEEAELILSDKHGRTRELFFNTVPIQMIYDRWTDEFSSLWGQSLTAFKYKLEAS